MTCAGPAERVCGPCQRGLACAYVLKLDAGQVAQEQRLQRIAGDTPRYVNLKARGPEQRPRAEKPEPAAELVCKSCGRRFAMFAYLVEFLNLRGAPMLACEECR